MSLTTATEQKTHLYKNRFHITIIYGHKHLQHQMGRQLRVVRDVDATHFPFTLLAHHFIETI